MDSFLHVELGTALAQPDPVLFYRECARQYQALHRTDTHATRSQNIDLPLFYRNLFEEAIGDLDRRLRWRLLAVCFAYKVRDRVLEYLSLLGNHSDLEWVTRLQEVVKNHGRDSAFEDDDDDDGVNEAEDQVNAEEKDSRRRSFGLPALSHRPKNDETEISAHSDTKTQSRYFIIPTLPLAYPQSFFSDFFSNAPPSYFTVPNILSHPAASQYYLSEDINARLRQDISAIIEVIRETADSKNPLPNDNDNELRSSSTNDLDSTNIWDDFYTQILRGDALFHYPEIHEAEPDNDIIRNGYTEVDIGIWCAQWRGQKQSDSGLGLQEKLRLRAAAKQAKESKEAEPTVANEDTRTDPTLQDSSTTTTGPLPTPPDPTAQQTQTDNSKTAFDADDWEPIAYWSTDDDDEGGPDAPRDEEDASKHAVIDAEEGGDGSAAETTTNARKRVRFNAEAIASFRSIPARPAKRRRVARKNW